MFGCSYDKRRAVEELPIGVSVCAKAFSDYFPLLVTLDTLKPHACKGKGKYRKSKDLDVYLFIDGIKNSGLHNMSSTDISELVKTYDDTLTALLNEQAPLVEKKVYLRPHAPWFNADIQKAKQERRKAERKWLSNKLSVYWDILCEKRKYVNKLCDEAKVNYYQQKIRNSNDSKTLYNITNNMLKGKRAKPLPEAESDSILANQFMDFFSSKISKITETFPDIDLQSCEENLDNCFTVFKAVTTSDLSKIILEGNSKCCQLDPILTQFLKQC